jgi:hypothetical protein
MEAPLQTPFIPAFPQNRLEDSSFHCFGSLGSPGRIHISESSKERPEKSHSD